MFLCTLREVDRWDRLPACLLGMTQGKSVAQQRSFVTPDFDRSPVCPAPCGTAYREYNPGLGISLRSQWTIFCPAHVKAHVEEKPSPTIRKGRAVVQALLGTSIDSSAKYTILAILPIAFGGDKV